jgi:hypothetical protein
VAEATINKNQSRRGVRPLARREAATLGEVEGANIIKVYWRSGKLSYLVCPEIENDPHPAPLRIIALRAKLARLTAQEGSMTYSTIRVASGGFKSLALRISAGSPNFTAQKEKLGEGDVQPRCTVG